MHIKHIYLVGPGGVGKTTTGPILAELLRLPFIDLDEEFCLRLENIGVYIKNYGYKEYVSANSQLFSTILSLQKSPAVIALSSGFLATDVLPKIVEDNRLKVKKTGTSILLLPKNNANDAATIVVERQMTRGFNLNPETEIKKFLDRVQDYSDFADYEVDSSQDPLKVAQSIYSTVEPNLETI